jgi:E3 ubiquitin-protein ligase RNF5
MTVRAGAKSCPMCKAPVDEDKVVPIYSRGGDGADPRDAARRADAAATPAPAPVPRRPAGQQPPARARSDSLSPATSGLGLLPALFGAAPPPRARRDRERGDRGGAAFDALTPEQAHQAFLSRLLLMLGSFVIMCLLLF